MAGVLQNFLLASIFMWIAPIAIIYAFNYQIIPGLYFQSTYPLPLPLASLLPSTTPISQTLHHRPPSQSSSMTTDSTSPAPSTSNGPPPPTLVDHFLCRETTIQTYNNIENNPRLLKAASTSHLLRFIDLLKHDLLPPVDHHNCGLELGPGQRSGSSQLSPSSHTLISGFVAVISVNVVIVLYIIMAMKEPVIREPQPDPTFLADAKASINQSVTTRTGTSDGGAEAREKEE